MARRIVLGLDVGVASVGWGLIDKKTGEIIDKGVRLFSEADSAENVKRRQFRSTRRHLRRKEFRLYRTRRLLLEMGVIDDISFVPLLNPYAIRCKGLNEKLTKPELATAILHLMKRNGYRYEVADDEESGGASKISEDYLCQHQLRLLDTSGKIRGHENRYHYSLYEKEMIKLLETQKISQEAKAKLIDLFSKRRHYSEGPGSANSPTPYGRYLSLGAEPINLIEKMRGHCSIYPEELRAPKVCPSAELFNFLNDLNNITIVGNHISQEKKADIIETYILGRGGMTIRQLETALGKTIIDIDGLRKDKKQKPILTEFKSLKKVKEATKKAGIAEYSIDSFDDLRELDIVFEILTQVKSIEERIEKLQAIGNSKLTEEHIKCFAKISEVANYHSLSLRAFYELTGEMLVTSKNSQEIVVTISNNMSQRFASLKLPKDIIMSPVAYKAINQTLKIVSAVIKEYGNLDSIVIEMAREKNTKDLKDKISESQKKRREEKEAVLALLEKHGVSEPNGALIEKILLYIEQDGKSAYSGKAMDIGEIIARPSAYEVDHIIPYSISLDDSRSNKVLVFGSENQIKGQRTPYQVFANHPHDWQSWEDFEAISRKRYFMKNPGKLNKLLEKRDINSSEVQSDFISRNLNDTRYISKEVLSILRGYFAHKNIATNVHVVNGLLTNQVRRIASLIKDRNMYSHHAVDAVIIASFLKSKYLESGLRNNWVDYETGEVFLNKDYADIFGPVVESVVKQLMTLDPISDFRFSYKVDTKANRSISDQTLYGTKYENGELYAVKKYADIYDKPGEQLAGRIRENKDIEKLLIFRNDKKTFVLLQKIVASYPNEKNPFLAYKKEHGDFIRKISKNGKLSPAIISIRYIEDRINTSLDLGHKYFKPVNGKGHPTKLQLSPYRMDLYQNATGTYKFVTVRYADIRYKKSHYIIDQTWYEAEKARLEIEKTYLFCNSFYRGDLMKWTDSKSITHLDIFKTVNNPLAKTVEMSFFGKETLKEADGEFKRFQYIVTLGKSVTNIQKIGTDILGRQFVIQNEPLRMEWE